MRHAARQDANQRELVTALEQLGWLVDDLSRAGNGCPDLVVTRGDITRLVEVKMPKGKRTMAQIKFHDRHHVVVIRSLADCAALR